MSSASRRLGVFDRHLRSASPSDASEPAALPAAAAATQQYAEFGGEAIDVDASEIERIGAEDPLRRVASGEVRASQLLSAAAPAHPLTGRATDS